MKNETRDVIINKVSAKAKYFLKGYHFVPWAPFQKPPCDVIINKTANSKEKEGILSLVSAFDLCDRERERERERERKK